MRQQQQHRLFCDRARARGTGPMGASGRPSSSLDSRVKLRFIFIRVFSNAKLSHSLDRKLAGKTRRSSSRVPVLPLTVDQEYGGHFSPSFLVLGH
ncbi:hypothetical protein EVAR_4533_1 [Eumeta japonica]|uniref:Uncharacterized protein n=1 Tax=Eumeta variegata TaxID=151549 RepID=A0A4C1SYX1_EUMVA|nr:hypothetical protein EVAR_4533_1 [Eumeta japonica]